MNHENKIVSILEAESEKPCKFLNQSGDLSAWSESSSFEFPKRTISTANPKYSTRPTPKISKRFSRSLHSQEKRPQVSEIPQISEIPHERRISTQVFSKISTSFTAYINSLIAKNSQIIKKYDHPIGYSDHKKLEIISVKLVSSHEQKRTKSFSPDKLKLKIPKFLEDSFLIHKKMPPSVDGCSITFYNKFQRHRGKNFTMIPNPDFLNH